LEFDASRDYEVPLSPGGKLTEIVGLQKQLLTACSAKIGKRDQVATINAPVTHSIELCFKSGYFPASCYLHSPAAETANGNKEHSSTCACASYNSTNSMRVGIDGSDI
jgi:hypothetical protein